MQPPKTLTSCLMLKPLHNLLPFSQLKRLTLVVMLALFAGLVPASLHAQLDTIHYLPPVHGPQTTTNTPYDQYVYLSTTRAASFQVQVFSPNNMTTPIATYTISRAVPAIHTVGTGNATRTFVVRDSLMTVLKNRGLILRAPYPFYANFRVRAGSGNAASAIQAEMISCQGQAAFGTTFRAGVAPIASATGDRSFFLSFMATEDNTTVQISGYNNNVVFAAPNNTTDLSNSLTVVLPLKGQSYVISGYSQSNAANLTGFVGALVTSDKPIVVNNGNWTGTISDMAGNQDIMANQAVPIERIGTDYVCVRGNGANNMEQPLVIAHSNNTQVFIAGSTTPFATLNAGQYTLIPESNYSGVTHESMYIRTSQPAYLYQPLGGGTSQANVGMNLIPPISCLLPDEAVIPSLNSIGAATYNGDMVILTRQSSNVTINSVLQPGAQAITGLTGWETYRIGGVTGNADIQSTGPMSVALFGYSGAAAYAGYYSGFGTAPGAAYLSAQGSGNCLPGILQAVPAGNQYQWVLNNSVISPVTTNPLLSISTNGDYKVIVTNLNNTCTDTSATITVLAQPSVANAGANQSVCGLNATLAATAPTVGTGIWSQVSGPGAATFTNPAAASSPVTVTVQGSYVFQWTITNGTCPPATDQVTVQFFTNPSASNAGLDRSVCGLNTNLAGNVPAIGTGTWTQTAGPGTSTFANDNLATSFVSVTAYGVYTYRWTISNGPCPVTQDNVVITFLNNPTTATAGANQNVCGLSATLAGNTPTNGTGTWSFISGPGTATFSNATSPSSGVTVTAYGAYVLEWSISNNVCAPSTDQVTITFNNNPTTANAGTNQTVCGLTSVFAGNTPTVGTGTWARVSGPGTASFSAVNSATSTVAVTLPGTYVFSWTITNAPCAPSSDQITITFVANPSTVNAGTDQTLCGLTTTLAGNSPTAPATGQWSLVSGPGTPSFTNAAQNNSSVTVNQYGVYTFEWAITNGTCPPITDEVVVTFVAPPSASNAGPTQTICGNITTLAANTPAVGTGTWAQVSGPGTLTFSAANSPTSTVQATVSGTYVASWTISNAPCTPPTTSTVQLNFTSTTITVNAGPNQNVCALTATLAANAPIAPATAIWSTVSGPGTATFSSLSNPSAGVTVTQPGVYVFQWTITSPPCAPVNDQVQITFKANVPNANAGPNQTICGTSTLLAGNAVTAPIQGTWTQVSGPGTSGFSPNATTANATVNVSVAGVYTFQWRLTNNPCPASQDQVQITFLSTTITSNAGADQSRCGLTATMAANTPTAPATGLWTQVSGPGTTTFSNTASATTTTTASVAGVYVYQWTVSSSPCTPVSDQVQVTYVTASVAANAGSNQTQCGLTATLAGNAPTNGGVGTWTPVSGPGTVSFVNPNSPTTDVTVSLGGTYVLSWTITNSPCPSTTDNVQLILGASPTIANAGNPDSVCGLSATLAANTALAGTGTWTLVNGPGTASFSNPSSPTATATVTAPGVYTYAWTISLSPCPPTTDQVQITYFATPTTANAGPNQTACGLSATLVGNTPVNGTGAWTQVSGPGIAGFAPNPNTPGATVTVSQTGTYVFRWQIANGSCPPSNDNVQIIFNPGPTIPNAGPDHDVCGLSDTLLSANTPTAPATGQWALVSGPGTATFLPNASNTNPTVNVSVLGTYRFVWRITLAPCTPIADTVEVEFRGVPTAANAGPNQVICGAVATLAGNTPTVGTGSWNVAGGPGIVSFSNVTSPTSLAVASLPGIYTLEWIIDNSPCPSSIDPVQLDYRPSNLVSNAGPDQTVCGLSVTMAANAPTAPATGQWSYISGPVANVPNSAYSPNRNSPTATITVSQYGTYVFQWSITTGTCAPITDQITITFNQAPVSNAGNDIFACGLSTQLDAVTPVAGAGKWILVSGPAGGTIGFTNENSDSSIAIVNTYGTYVLAWEVTNPPCPPSSNQVNVTFIEQPAPAFAGGDQQVCGLTTSMFANPPSAGSGLWFEVVTPNGVGNDTITYANQTSSGTQITVSTGGTYVFVWEVRNDPCIVYRDSVTIFFADTPTVANAGIDTSVCGLTMNLTGNTPLAGDGKWTLLSAPTGDSAQIADDTLANSAVTVSDYGSYVFAWTIGNLPCAPYVDQIVVTFVEPPQPANAGVDTVVCGFDYQLAATPKSPTSATGLWTLVSGPDTINFSNPNAENTFATVATAGIYTLVWQVSNDPCTPETDTVIVEFSKCDNDSDGIVDNADIDDDNDGLLDVVEANFALPGGDTDGDGKIDAFDNDSDNDGIADVIESGGIDPDNDGAYGNSPIPDQNNDGLTDLVPPIGLAPLDNDGDGRPNFQDLDSDQDGLNDLDESGRSGLDANSDGVVDGPDSDNDGLPDLIDPSLGNGPTPTPRNTDGDGVADYLDLDSDNDAIHDVVEANLSGLDANADGLIDGADTDQDGIADLADANISGFGDPDPADGGPDSDGDGVADYRDLDSDNDGINDITESRNDAVDFDSNGMVDGGDTDNDGVPNAVDTNINTFGDPDGSNAVIDTDADGIGDYRDLDSDNDAINDLDESGITGLDTNSDGVVDGADTDGDGIVDLADATVGVGDGTSLDAPIDTDRDSIPDFRDLDSDNDGINDIVEAGYSNLDADSDGVADAGDQDLDGIVDVADLTPTTFGDADSNDIPTDTDGDLRPDYADLDSDQDGINDIIEAGFGALDTNNDGIVDGTDTDNDGIVDGADLTPTQFGDIDPNDNPLDTDGDGVPNYEDLDSDNDGIDDITESGNAAFDANNDGIVDGGDLDKDGIADLADATIGVYGDGSANSAIADTDNDGVDDYLDLDSDNDGVNDIIEGGLASADTDGDGIVDGTTDSDGDGIRDPVDGEPNAFGDGAGNATVPDTDGDGSPDFRDLDSDGDSIYDLIEGAPGVDPSLDANNDGVIDGVDTDGDGIIDAVDGNNGAFGDANTFAPDTDSDGTPDFQDLDTDDDGLPDGQFDETPDIDCNGDGIANWRDDKPCALIIPDVFTVNGDQVNDFFEIGNIEAFETNKVTIFNRWGNIVFEADGYDNDDVRWEGQNTADLSAGNGLLPEGTYFYVIEVGEGQIYKGYVYLMTR